MNGNGCSGNEERESPAGRGFPVASSVVSGSAAYFQLVLQRHLSGQR